MIIIQKILKLQWFRWKSYTLSFHFIDNGRFINKIKQVNNFPWFNERNDRLLVITITHFHLINNFFFSLTTSLNQNLYFIMAILIIKKILLKLQLSLFIKFFLYHYCIIFFTINVFGRISSYKNIVNQNYILVNFEKW
jgi:hypothetical protein